MDDAFYQKLQNRCKVPGGEILTYDEVMQWPQGHREELEREGKIRQTENSDQITCVQCPEGCSITPYIRTDPATGKLTGTTVCPDDPDIGRFAVDLNRRMRWEIVKEKLPASSDQSLIGSADDEWISFDDAMGILDVSKPTISRWVDDGRLQSNGETGRDKRISKFSALLLKEAIKNKNVLKDAKELNADANKLGKAGTGKTRAKQPLR